MSTHRAQSHVVRIIVNGAAGRMGARLCALAQEDRELSLVGALTRSGAQRSADAARASASKITDNPANFNANSADVVIDFSSDAGVQSALSVALRINAALVVGTTALSPSTTGLLREASSKIPVLVAANTSLGVAALSALIERGAALLGPSYHCSIVEAHHIAKKDAPSGTALRLAESARRGGAVLPDDQIVSIRGGDVVGEHIVRFAGPGEYIEFTHRATSRDLFARGALRAAKWLRGQKPGWWTMSDVLGLSAR